MSEIILKIDHEKGMKSATLLADRNARIAADKALTAQLHLLAVQQQQIVRTYFSYFLFEYFMPYFFTYFCCPIIEVSV